MTALDARSAGENAAARTTARMLLEIGAVDIRGVEAGVDGPEGPEGSVRPYMLTSGLASPCYIDCRRVISFPRARSTAMDAACALLAERAGVERFDAIAGGETAGIPFAAWIAERLALPMLYVRKKPKGFGRGARIEGHFPEGARVLLVEDLTTDGGSKVNFVEALREAGAECAHTVVLFYYSIFPEVPGRLAERGITLHALATWDDILAEARLTDRFSPKAISALEAFLADPLAWSAAHGGRADHSLSV
ncbi:MAG: orotate phosphoribosyltransferase [Pseudomonadota bacterium]